MSSATVRSCASSGSSANSAIASASTGHAGAHLAVQDDGNLVVYGPGVKALWAANTYGE